MKLKTNKTYTKKPRKKIRNQNNINQIGKYSIFILELKDEIENK
jgi:hypothetical protein